MSKKLIGQMPVHTEILGPCRPCLDFQECRMMQIAVAGILIISATYFPPPEQNWGAALGNSFGQLFGPALRQLRGADLEFWDLAFGCFW